MSLRDRPPGAPTATEPPAAYRRTTTGEHPGPVGRPGRPRAVTQDIGGDGGEVVVLTVLRGRHAGKQYRLGPVAIIGRGEEADVPVPEGDVSRRHARILARPGGEHVVEDLGSRNGIRVNGETVERAVLAVGDHIGLGAHTVLVFSRRSAEEEQLIELQKLESLGRLAGGVAHDFNNILAVVLGNTELARGLLREPGSDPTLVEEILADVVDASNRGADLVRQLLGFARRGAYQESSVDLSAMVQEVGHFASRTFERTVSIDTDVSPGLAVVGDRTQLFQMLMNLCLNARDAMPEGGRILLRARRREGQPAPLAAEDSRIEIEVSDTGVGIDAEARKRIFEPFFTTKGAGKGTGLGLSVVFGIVSRHGGRISVRSEPGQGTTFQVDLPEADPELVRREDGQVTLTPSDRWGLAGGAVRIALVVDDEALVRRSVGRMLARLGYRVLEAANGREAQRQLAEAGEPVSVMVLDLIMPEMDGVEILRWLRERRLPVPVLVMSGYHDERVHSSLAELGVVGFLPKPFTEPQLQAALNLATSVA